MTNKTLMIYNALEWAQNKLNRQSLIDLATAMGIDEKRHCKGCMDGELHFEDQCVVCGTHNVCTLFDVEINPFTREVHIVPTYSDYRVSCADIKFNDLDDWSTFTYQETIYDVHFYYDGEFSLEIYPRAPKSNDEQVDAYNENFSESLTNKLQIKY